MNENIKKLAEQAGLWDILDQLSYEFEDYVTEKECGEELEKFAELLILNVIDNISDCTVEQCTRSQIVEELKTEYGVE